eukprot:8185151-Lingulodinium_polyedra.AAC.1
MTSPRGEGEPSALGVERDADAEMALWEAQLGEQHDRTARANNALLAFTARGPGVGSDEAQQVPVP